MALLLLAELGVGMLQLLRGRSVPAGSRLFILRQLPGCRAGCRHDGARHAHAAQCNPRGGLSRKDRVAHQPGVGKSGVRAAHIEERCLRKAANHALRAPGVKLKRERCAGQAQARGGAKAGHGALCSCQQLLGVGRLALCVCAAAGIVQLPPWGNCGVRGKGGGAHARRRAARILRIRK